MKGIDQVLWLCYGNHPRASSQKEYAEELILVLRSEHNIARQELIEYLGFNPEDETDVRHFDRIVSPLRGNNELGVKIVTSYKEGRQTYYSLSHNAFTASIQSAVKNIKHILTDDENKRLKELAGKLPEADDW